MGEEQGGEKIPALEGAQREDLGIGGWPLGSAIPTVVRVVAVAVFLPVGFVVLLVMAHEVAQCEAVMAGDEIQARTRAAAVVAVEIAAAGKACGEFSNTRARAFPEAADAIPVAPVPFCPKDGEVADLIPIRAEIPRFGDEFHIREDGILVDDVEKGSEAIHLPQFPRQRAREIETEAIDMHFLNPVAEGIHDELEHTRVGDIQGISAAREIDVARSVGIESVVAGIVDAAHGEDGAGVVALGGVVIDDIENHFDPCRVEHPHHFLEFIHGILGAGGAKTRIGRKVAERVVAPVVHEAAIDDMLLVGMEMNGHQLDGGDAEALEVGDGSLAGQTRVGAAQFFGNLGMPLCEALHMKFVENRVVPGCAGRKAAVPSKGGIDHAGEGGGRGGVGSGIQNRGIPHKTPRNRFGIRVEEDFVRMETMSRGWFVWPMDAVAIDQPRPRSVQVAVPDLVGFLRKCQPPRLGSGFGGVEQAQLNKCGVLRKQREIHARAIPGRSERSGFARPDGMVVDHETAGGRNDASWRRREWGVELRSGRGSTPLVKFPKCISRKRNRAVDRRSGAEFGDDAGEDLADAVDFGGSRDAAEREAEGGFGLGVGEAHGFENMGGFAGAGGAGGSGRAANAALVQENESGFTLDAVEGKVGGVGQAVGAAAVDRGSGNLGEEGVFESVAQGGITRGVPRDFSGFAEGNDAGDILRAASAGVFLRAAQEGSEGNAAVGVESADAFRRMKFVARKTHEMDAEAFQAERNFTEGLHGVDVEDGAGFLNHRGDLFQRPEDTGFVVGPKERDKSGIGADCAGELVEIDLSEGIDWQAGDLKTFSGQMLAKPQCGAVLNLAGDDVAFRGVNREGGVKCRIDRLGAAAGENPLVRLASR